VNIISQKSYTSYLSATLHGKSSGTKEKEEESNGKMRCLSLASLA
jgi:hypothetical protein